MNESHRNDARPAPAADAGFGPLRDAMRIETGLARDLRLALVGQRAAVASSETPAVEEATQRILEIVNALVEARAAQAAALLGLVGEPGVGLGEVEARLGRSLPADVASARGELLRAAREAADELAINRTVLRRAADSGDRLLDTVFRALGRTMPSYGAGNDRRPGGDRSAVFIDKVA